MTQLILQHFFTWVRRLTSILSTLFCCRASTINWRLSCQRIYALIYMPIHLVSLEVYGWSPVSPSYLVSSSLWQLQSLYDILKAMPVLIPFFKDVIWWILSAPVCLCQFIPLPCAMCTFYSRGLVENLCKRQSNRLKRDTLVHYLTSILSTRKFEHQFRQIPDLVMLLEQKLSVQKFRQMQWRVLYHLSSPAGWRP